MSCTIVTATSTEARAVRRAAPGAQLFETGMGLSKYNGERFDEAIVCGLGGGLRSNVPSGTIVVASEVGRVDGSHVRVDASLRDALVEGAEELGFEPLVAPLLFSRKLITGNERARWAARGFVAVDMESGGIDAASLGVVRVILDTPEREISPQWVNPAIAMWNPRLWGEFLFLARYAPNYAKRAASVVAAAISSPA